MVVPSFLIGFGCVAASQVLSLSPRVDTAAAPANPLDSGGFRRGGDRVRQRRCASGVYPGAPRAAGVVVLGAVADLAIALIPLSLAVALLRHGLFDVDALIGRTLVYGVLTLVVVAIYVVLVGYLGSLFHTADNVFISLLATGAVAVLFQPMRQQLQRGVNRLLYGQRDEPYLVLSNLGRRLAATSDPTALLPAVVETIARALKVPHVAIETTDSAPVVLAAVGVAEAT